MAFPPFGHIIFYSILTLLSLCTQGGVGESNLSLLPFATGHLKSINLALGKLMGLMSAFSTDDPEGQRGSYGILASISPPSKVPRFSFL